MTTMEDLFVYGTLRDPQVLLNLIGRVAAGVPDQLHGFERRFDLLPPYPVAMPAIDTSIDGLVLSVTPEELAAFDRYEGSEYIRVHVTLGSGKEVWIYRGNPAIYGDASTR